MQFYDYLILSPSSDDLDCDLNYVLDRILFNIESFRVVMHSYCVLVGSTSTTIDWKAMNLATFKDEFTSTYEAFVKETNFESKCRLLLDLVKLQLVFAGAFYDRLPQV